MAKRHVGRKVAAWEEPDAHGQRLGNGDECLGRARWVATALLPFLQCAYRTPQKCGKPGLGQAGFMRADTAGEMGASVT